MSEESNNEQQDSILIELLKQKISLYCNEHEYAEQYTSLLVKFFTPTKTTTLNNFHLTFYENKKEIFEAFAAIPKEALIEFLNNYPILLNALYIEILNDDTVGFHRQIQFGIFLKSTIENFSQIQGVNIDEHLKIISFIDKNNERIQKEKDSLIEELYRKINIKEPKYKESNLFIWQKDEKIIEKLFNELSVKYELIEDNLQKFKSIFQINGTPLAKFTGKLHWIKEPLNTVQIGYLFHSLCDKGYINESQSRKINTLIKRLICYKSENSTSLNNIATTYSKFKTKSKNKSEDTRHIDDIIASLK
jgi:hypothetical protein